MGLHTSLNRYVMFKKKAIKALQRSVKSLIHE